MITEIAKKIKKNMEIYKADIEAKGLYWSVMHRLYKLPFGKKIIEPVTDLLKPSYLIIDGNILQVDKKDRVISQELIQTGKWEDFETKIFKNNINTGDVVLDIGAHIGYYTVIAAKIVGKEGRVYAFEPDPKNFSILQNNIALNGYKNVTLINKAVSDTEGLSNLFLNTKNTGDHRIYKSEKYNKGVKIETITLDNFFKSNTHIDLIKIDIQGAEVRALKGGQKIIKENENLKIITEFWPKGLKLCGNSAEEYTRFILKNNFKIFEINEQTKSIVLTNTKKLLESTGTREHDFKNLFCTRTSIQKSNYSSSYNEQIRNKLKHW